MTTRAIRDRQLFVHLVLKDYHKDKEETSRPTKISYHGGNFFMTDGGCVD